MLSPGSPPDGEYDASPAELPITPHSEHHSRSRTSSFSSITSDASMFAPVSFSQRQYVLPSDAESCSEVCMYIYKLYLIYVFMLFHSCNVE